jgi:hypothetical protein
MACALGGRSAQNIGVASLAPEARCQILSNVHAHTLSRWTMHGGMKPQRARDGCSQTSRAGGMSAGKPELVLAKV